MIEQEFQKLLDREWLDEERELIEKIIESVLYYKKFLPRQMKDDVIRALQLCNQLKEKLEILSKRLEEYELTHETKKESENE